uniref:Peptidase S1 domain-containing protein n=1 Tax=Anopheles dirus TaxID=7168 RepID=A0A3F2YVY3_9DIPT
MGPETRRFVLIVTCLTGAIASSITSLQHRGQHTCNAVHVVNEFFITAAACLGHSDPPTITLVSSELAHKVRCNVTQYQRHPKYVFLNHNLAVVQAQCEPEAAPEGRTSISDASESDDLLTLLGFGGSLQEVSTRLKLQHCSVCQKQYEVFDCKRQMCVKPAGNDFRKRSNLNGLAGAGLYNQHGELVGIVSYGFAGASYVAERVSYYGQFLQSAMKSFKDAVGANNPTSRG